MGMMKYRQYKYLVDSDLYRITGRKSLSDLFKQLVMGDGYKYCFWLRTCEFLRSRAVTKYSLYPIALLILRHYSHQLGIMIPIGTEIGSGFYIGHFGTIVVHPCVRIGRNCNISQGVTIGISGRAGARGVPVIGENVYIGPGAKLFGKIVIGNNVAIGANAVVTKDLPDHSVAVGVPARVISSNGSAGYVAKTDY